MADARVCRDCFRVNPPDAETCIGCGGDNFDDLNFTPDWDSAEPYKDATEGG